MDRDEFVSFYAGGFARVYRAALACCGDRMLAEDATQDAFAKALVRWSRLRTKPWAIGWVISTAMNGARRAVRGRPLLAEPDERGAPYPDVVGRADVSMDLSRAIHLLPRRQQEALLLAYVADLPLREVARLMRCRVGTVKAHLWRAREALREAWEVDDEIR